MGSVAYDYNRQCWVQGSEADTLIHQQEREELELLEGPEGERYSKMIGITETQRQQRIHTLINRLAER